MEGVDDRRGRASAAPVCASAFLGPSRRRGRRWPPAARRGREHRGGRRARGARTWDAIVAANALRFNADPGYFGAVDGERLVGVSGGSIARRRSSSSPRRGSIHVPMTPPTAIVLAPTTKSGQLVEVGALAGGRRAIVVREERDGPNQEDRSGHRRSSDRRDSMTLPRGEVLRDRVHHRVQLHDVDELAELVDGQPELPGVDGARGPQRLDDCVLRRRRRFDVGPRGGRDARTTAGTPRRTAHAEAALLLVLSAWPRAS